MSEQRPGGAPATAGMLRAKVFGLRKTWIDRSPGITMVQIQYTWTLPGREPDWENAEELVLPPEPGVPALRSAVIEIPRFVGGSPDYLLHHFFFVVSVSGRSASPVFTEEILSQEITYLDGAGDFTSAGIVWGSEPQAAEFSPALRVENYTSMAMDGLPFEAVGADAPTEPINVYEFVMAQPLPHRFRGLVWGVRGTALRYVFHGVRHGSPNPADDTESWADNGSRGWIVEL